MGMDEVLQKIRSIADYQFGKGVGKILFPDGVELRFSGRTGRVKEVYFKGKLLATLRPQTGTFCPTIEGFKRIISHLQPPKFRVTVQDEVVKFVMKGKNVFAKHVKNADPNIRPEDEVVVVDRNDNVLAVGRAVLNGKEMLAFQRGIAVKVRHGIREK